MVAHRQKIDELIRMAKAAGATHIHYAEEEFSFEMGWSQNPVSDTPIPSPQQEATPAQTLDHLVSSPMVGTVYLTPEPGAKPFISVGQKVKKGDVLCIIEVMKLFTKIKADCDAEILGILCEHESPVEFAQPLISMKPL